VDVEAGIIELDDGSTHKADLIVAADELNSVVRSAAIKNDTKPTPSGLDTFRFLIPTKILENEPALKEMYQRKAAGQGSWIIKDTTDKAIERHIIWYHCQGYVIYVPHIVHRLIFGSGEVQNFVGIHPTRDKQSEGRAEFADNARESLLSEFSHFHPDLLRIFRFVGHQMWRVTMLTIAHRLSEELSVKCWTLFDQKPLPTWQYGKVLLNGDSAHPVRFP